MVFIFTTKDTMKPTKFSKPGFMKLTKRSEILVTFLCGSAKLVTFAKIFVNLVVKKTFSDLIKYRRRFMRHRGLNQIMK